MWINNQETKNVTQQYTNNESVSYGWGSKNKKIHELTLSQIKYIWYNEFLYCFWKNYESIKYLSPRTLNVLKGIISNIHITTSVRNQPYVLSLMQVFNDNLINELKEELISSLKAVVNDSPKKHSDKARLILKDYFNINLEEKDNKIWKWINDSQEKVNQILDSIWLTKLTTSSIIGKFNKVNNKFIEENNYKFISQYIDKNNIQYLNIFYAYQFINNEDFILNNTATTTNNKLFWNSYFLKIVKKFNDMLNKNNITWLDSYMKKEGFEKKEEAIAKLCSLKNSINTNVIKNPLTNKTVNQYEINSK